MSVAENKQGGFLPPAESSKQDCNHHDNQEQTVDTSRCCLLRGFWGESGESVGHCPANDQNARADQGTRNNPQPPNHKGKATRRKNPLRELNHAFHFLGQSSLAST